MFFFYKCTSWCRRRCHSAWCETACSALSCCEPRISSSCGKRCLESKSCPPCGCLSAGSRWDRWTPASRLPTFDGKTCPSWTPVLQETCFYPRDGPQHWKKGLSESGSLDPKFTRRAKTYLVSDNWSIALHWRHKSQGRHLQPKHGLNMLQSDWKDDLLSGGAFQSKI